MTFPGWRTCNFFLPVLNNEKKNPSTGGFFYGSFQNFIVHSLAMSDVTSAIIFYTIAHFRRPNFSQFLAEKKSIICPNNNESKVLHKQ
jgi:hypothetical protein